MLAIIRVVHEKLINIPMYFMCVAIFVFYIYIYIVCACVVVFACLFYMFVHAGLYVRLFIHFD